MNHPGEKGIMSMPGAEISVSLIPACETHFIAKKKEAYDEFITS